MIDEKRCGLSFPTQNKLIEIFKKFSQIQKVILYIERVGVEFYAS